MYRKSEEKQRILVLNGSYTEENIIRIYKEMGLYVITSGNAPEASGHKYSDEYINHDYSDADGMLRIARSLNIDYVSACANDFGVISAAYIAEKLGLPGHDTYENSRIIGEKDRFKEFSQKNNLMVIPSNGFDDFDKALESAYSMQLPIIVKPTDLSGGKGVTRVEKSEDIPVAVRKAFTMSHVGHVVLEPYIVGSQHSITAYISNNKVVAYGTYNEMDSPNLPFLVGGTSSPASCSDTVIGMLIEQIEKMSSLLNLADGPFHVQFRMNDGKPLIMECMRRVLGNHALEELQLVTGIDWEQLIARTYCGMDCSKLLQTDKKMTYGAEFYVQAPHNGVLNDVRIDDRLKKYIVKDIVQWEKNMRISNYKVEKLEFVFLDFDTIDERDYICNNIAEYIVVDVEKD